MKLTRRLRFFKVFEGKNPKKEFPTKFFTFSFLFWFYFGVENNIDKAWVGLNEEEIFDWEDR